MTSTTAAAHADRRTARAAGPRVEALEGRRLMAATAQVDLAGSFNETVLTAADGGPGAGEGLNNDHYTWLALTATTLNAGGRTFKLGPVDRPNMVAARGQSVPLPRNAYPSLGFLALNHGGAPTRTLRVRYVDGTSQSYTLAMSPGRTFGGTYYYPGEAEAAVARNPTTLGPGTNWHTIRGYSLPLNPAKRLAGLGLPTGDFHLLAVDVGPTLPAADGVARVSLAGAFNQNGVAIPSEDPFRPGGFDGNGNWYGDDLYRGRSNPATIAGLTWTLGTRAPGANNVVAAAGQTLSLPQGRYHQLTFLGAAVGGGQLNQVFKVKYADGTTQTFTQSLSDWTRHRPHAGEAVAGTVGLFPGGGSAAHPSAANVYVYTLNLKSWKSVASITLPTNARVKLLALDLVA